MKFEEMKGMSEDQIIALEMEKSMRAREKGESMEVNETELYEKLAAPFPEEALTKDSSRGFDLTSVKAQYVVERLNEVLGVMNWTFGGEFKETDSGVLYMGALVITVNGKQNRQFAPGYAKLTPKKNVGDVYKSAATDSMCKCASKFGIANDVFKGLVTPPGSKASKGKALTKKSDDAEEKKPAGFKTRRRTRSLK